MAKRVARRAVEAPPGVECDLVFVDPETVVLPDDERAALPLDEHHVDAIRAIGVVEPVVARRRGGEIHVIDGRLRTRWLREANRRNAADGRPTLLLPVVFRERGADDAEEVAIALNEIRLAGDSAMAKAQKAQRLRDGGWTLHRIGRAYGVSYVTVFHWTLLLKLIPELQAAVDRGDLEWNVARKLARLPAAEQAGAVERVRRDCAAARRERCAGVEAEDAADWHSDARAGVIQRDVKPAKGANGTPPGAASDARGRRNWTFYYRTGNRLRDLSKFVVQIDREALPPSFAMVLLWLLHDEGTTTEALVQAFPRLAPMFQAP